MKIQKILVMAISFIVFITGPSFAQDIISANDLAKVMKNSNSIIVSTRKIDDYKKIHVNGAINLDHKSLYENMSMLKKPNDIATILGNKGISQNMDIVVYDGGSGKYAGRVYWILKYMGAENVKILDGGMRAWRIARKPVTKNPSNKKTTQFVPKMNNSILASMSLVNKAKNNPAYIIVDVRSSQEYDGKASTKLRPGHVPSAVNFDFTQVLAPNGTLKSIPELTTLFSKLGITKDKEIILYCESSVRAGIVFMALKTGLKYPKVKVYDGAYLEWQSLAENKIEVSP